MSFTIHSDHFDYTSGGVMSPAGAQTAAPHGRRFGGLEGFGGGRDLHLDTPSCDTAGQCWQLPTPSHTDTTKQSVDNLRCTIEHHAIAIPVDSHGHPEGPLGC